MYVIDGGLNGQCVVVKEEESVRAGREINKMICGCSRQKQLRACARWEPPNFPLVNKSDCISMT